ncbi:MAG: hypothetical protein ACLU3F_00330 [Blautia wexlerae]
MKVRWGYLILLGSLFSLEVAAFSAMPRNYSTERMQAIKKADNQASVNWKLVSQEINEKNEYVYDGDKTDDTMSDRVLPKISDGSWGYVVNGKVQEAASVNAANLAGWWHVKNGWVDWSDGILETADGWHKYVSGKQEVTANETVESNPGDVVFLKRRWYRRLFLYRSCAEREWNFLDEKAGALIQKMTGVVPDTIE